jgi:hypothetical protein
MNLSNKFHHKINSIQFYSIQFNSYFKWYYQ